MAKKKRNTDSEIQDLRRRLDAKPDSAEALRALVVALLRVEDHRGLIALGAGAVPILMEIEESLSPTQVSPPQAPGSRPTLPLARAARVNLVRLELSILGPGAYIAAKPLGVSEKLSLWHSTGEFMSARDGSDAIRAYQASGTSMGRIPLTDIAHVGPKALEAFNAQAGGWRVARFGFANRPLGDLWPEGWVFGSDHNGAHRWNGWASPRMTLDQLKKFVDAWQKETSGQDGLRIELREEKDGPVLVTWDTNYPDDEETVIQPEWVEGPGAPSEPVWDAGLGLIWDEEEESEGSPEAGEQEARENPSPLKPELRPVKRR